MPTILQVLVFIIGVIGYGFVGYGLWLIHPPVAYMSCGAVACWWSWYVSIGIHLHNMPPQQGSE